MPLPSVWNQAGPAIGDLVRSRLHGTQVIDIALDPPERPRPQAEILLAWPRRDLPAECRADVDVRWASEVRWVHSVMAGIDDYPPALLAERIVTCGRGLGAIPISEYVLAAILSREKAAGRTLHGRTLGIVGLGEIGTATARRALAFGMRVIATRRTAHPSPVAGVRIETWDELLASAQDIVLTAPATPATRSILDARAFDRLRPGAHVINVARGSLIDNEALLAALANGTVAAATLDVTEPEPLPPDHPLRTHPNVTITPHVSARDPHGLARVVDRFATNYRSYLAGRTALDGLVDLAAGY